MRYLLIGGLLLGTLLGVAQPKPISKPDSGARKALVLLPYNKVIPDGAYKKQGLFTVSSTDGKWYFEIADSILKRKLLVVTRYISTPQGITVYGGEKANEQTVYFEKMTGNKLVLRAFLYRQDSPDSTQVINRALQNSGVDPIVAIFDVKAVNPLNGNKVIDVTDFLKKDNPVTSIPADGKSELKLGSLADDRSFINKINAYPINVEIKSTKTYTTSSPATASGRTMGVVTFGMNTSIVLLPATPMKKRLFDDRVGYFAERYVLFDDNSQRTKTEDYIQHYRLEPKPEDLDKYNHGILVEPQKQIVYYIDPATPKKWRPYLIAGVNDWQKAFEKAGFKNAIIAKEWPESDTTMSLEDARFSVIRYAASETPNAYGPRISDPRSGEIIESHVVWFHNVMKLLHSWYMLQAGAIDPRARKMEFDDELMGELIRFVSSHEIGHTLGLRHNMGASSQTPVEKLRDKKWVEANGHTVSIMDYARFNYVAQPEDHIGKAGIYPRIGAYDKWAIQWGYRQLPGNLSTDAETRILNKLIVDSLKANPRLWFGGEGKNEDPRSQSEDLGDDVVKANDYGIKNLKRVVPQLPLWTREEGDLYDNLAEMHKGAVAEYRRFLYHVMKNIAGRYVTVKSVEQSGSVYTEIPRARVKETISYIGRQLFEAPLWLYPQSITSKINVKAADNILDEQNQMLNIMLSPVLLYNLHNIALQSNDPYNIAEYLNDVKKEVWKNFGKNEAANSYRRSLQRSYIEKLNIIINPKDIEDGKMMSNAQRDDTRLTVLDHTKKLKAYIKQMIPVNPANSTHLNDMVHQIDKILYKQSKL